MKHELHLGLLSDATFGRGDGVAGLVDEEVEHDAATGLPFIRGRTLKGLLVEECANILYALNGRAAQFDEAAKFLFGQSGSAVDDDALMRIGPALLSASLRAAVKVDVAAGLLTAADVLESLTAIRRQTAMDETGAPERGSLRAMRVVLRDTPLVAELTFREKPPATALPLLAACALGLRRGGTGRNRGRGRLEAFVDDRKATAEQFAQFCTLVEGDAL